MCLVVCGDGLEGDLQVLGTQPGRLPEAPGRRGQARAAVRHLRARLGHGPERAGKTCTVESCPVWAADVHRASKMSGVCVPVWALAQGVFAGP